MNPTTLPPYFFDPSRPVFVKADKFQVATGFLKQGDFYDWENLCGDPVKIQQLFYSEHLHHNPELEEVKKASPVVGDGLDGLNIEQLHTVIDVINNKVKMKVKNNSEYTLKKCPKVAKDVGTQIRKIRFWRTTYGDLEN